MEVRRAYELLVLSSPTLSEDERGALLNAIVEVIQSNGGEIFFRSSMGKRVLAYPIQKQREGWYDLFYFAAYPSQLAPMERWLKLNAHVMRYMLIRIHRAHFRYLQAQHGNLQLPEGVSLARLK